MPQERPADLVLKAGAVYTLDAARRWAEAVAVRDGRIVAVGTDRDVRRLAGRRTEVIDLAGRMLLPGFQDAHAHPVKGGLNRLQCDLGPYGTAAEYVAAVHDYAGAHAGRPWITGGGWSMAAFPGGTPTAALLDGVDRPVLLRNRDGHGAWVNRRALELAGIDRDTPDPADGRIERDASGDPTGALHEGAMRLVAALVPRSSDDELVEALRLAQTHLHSLGITAWQDAIVGMSEGFPDPLVAYRELERRGELTARVVGALWWDRERDLEQIAALVETRRAETRARFRPTAVKIMQDGVCENFTAALLEPYLDAQGAPTGNRGLSFLAPDLLAEAVTRLDAEGFGVHVHAIGDRAVREALDGFAAARAANGLSGNRHHIAHLQVVHPDDVPRFRALGVAANAQPLWAMHEPQMDELTIPFLGPERAARQYPWGALVRSGAHLAMGSDWPVSSPNVLEQVHVAVNRAAWPGCPGVPAAGRVFLAEQRIDLPAALAAFTINSAYVNGLDDKTGSIEVGKAADLTVLDRNVFAEPVDELHAARVVATLVDGVAMFDDL